MTDVALSGAETAARYRKANPARARLVAQQNYARAAAARELAARHADEFEALMVAECERRGIPRYLPPKAKRADRRTIPFKGRAR